MDTLSLPSGETGSLVMKSLTKTSRFIRVVICVITDYCFVHYSIGKHLIVISTCMQSDTARVIFSWNDADPVNDEPNQVMNHGSMNRGAASVNLLGGQQEVPPDPADLESFDITVDAVCLILAFLGVMHVPNIVVVAQCHGYRQIIIICSCLLCLEA